MNCAGRRPAPVDEETDINEPNEPFVSGGIWSMNSPD
jgi:hypothetical protein